MLAIVAAVSVLAPNLLNREDKSIVITKSITKEVPPTKANLISCTVSFFHLFSVSILIIFLIS